MNAVDAAIHGFLPETYDRLFSPSDVRIELQTTRSAYDTLRKFLAEVPVLPHAETLGKRESGQAKNKAELVEKVCHGYHHGSAMRGGPGFDTIVQQLANRMVAFYDAVLLVHPDHDRRLVYLETKDPRCHFPPEGWTPWSQVPLDGTLLVYEKTLGEVKRMFAYDSYGMATDVLPRLNNAYKPQFGYGQDSSPDDSQIIEIGAYRSRDAWFVVAMGDNDIVLVESETGDRFHPGVCGVASFKQDGSPLLTGQIGIEAGLMKVMNQQIQNTDRINQAPIVGPPLQGDELRWGEYNVIDMQLLQGRQFLPQRLAPDSPSNLTQVMGSLLALAEKFNYNPESAQGAGPAVSGKAIQQLQAGPRSLVTGILFGPYKTAFPRAYDDCMEMEINLWPNDRRTARGRAIRQTFEIDYTPSVALAGYKGHVRIEDARPGGYNAFLESVQKRDAGMASLRDVLERDPDVRDVEATIRRIDSDATEKFMQAAFEALGGQDPLRAIDLTAELLKRIQGGKSKTEAIQDMKQEGLLAPPAPEVPEGLPAGAGGLPPELQGLLGGGAPEEAPVGLAQARGF